MCIRDRCGPTEVTVNSHSAVIDLNDASQTVFPIGTSLPNYTSYIVDRDLNPVPIGVIGEMMIGGAGVSKGYINNEEMTKSVFLPDTWTPSEYLPLGKSSKLYRTGDLGRMLADGSIVHCGRIHGDTQIKIHGIRTELTEIENHLVAASDGIIGKAVVTLRKDLNNLLIAHLEFATQAFKDVDKKAFVKALPSRLPLARAVIPSLMVPVDSIPLNRNGKVDRRAVAELELPFEEESGRSDEELTETELALKEIWLEVVGEEVAQAINITSDSDFFHIGGDSLALVNLQASIRERFNVIVPIIQLFDASTLQLMADKIESTQTTEAIDWDDETAVDQALIDLHSTQPYANGFAKGSGIKVLMTGPTGYLGSHLLKQLVEDDRVTEIHCVGVRAIAGGGESLTDELRKLPIESDKITVYAGELSLPRLGLSEETFKTLSSTMDVILASGANRSFWDQYQTLRDQNVGATKELTRLALSRSIPIHYISSGGLVENGDSPAESVSNNKPDNDRTSGYLASKWASEVYLENAAEELGIPVYIHRATPAPSTAAPAPSELTERFRTIGARLNALPDTQGFNGSFDLVHTGALVKAICDTTLEPAAEVKRHIHYPSSTRITTADMEAIFPASERKADVKLIHPFYWVAEAKRAGFDWHFATMDLDMGSSNGATMQSLKR